MKNFVQPGDVFTAVLTADAEPGEIIVAGEMCGVAVNGGKAGDEVSVERTGVFWCPKVNGAVTQGSMLYCKPDDKRLTKTAADNVFVGYAFADAAAADPDVMLVLKG